MTRVVIKGTGLFTPSGSITNDELVESLSLASGRWNEAHAAEIARGECAARDLPSAKFILRASGVGHRYVMDKQGVLDPARQRPRFPRRDEDAISIQAEIALAAANGALEAAGVAGRDLDAIVVGCSNLQRPYPAVAIEVQAALGAGGFAYDMNVACSSATFAIQNVVDALRNGHARRALVLNPEITSAHTNFELREFHFIFGDACTALVLEAEEEGSGSGEAWEILDTRLVTRFSNNIRNDAGFLNRCEEPPRAPHELLFRQHGRQVASEVCPMVAEHLRRHLADAGIPVERVRRLWLHQANLNMNRTIAKTLLGREVLPEEAPVILDEYANTSSAGSVIAFHKHRDGLRAGDHAVLCSFGAGYSIGSVLLRKLRD
ncbi:MAG: beta-ketoacyl-ACP synthase III [Deltaproteobacteria bacterium]|nr:beta-ketoacyl-ACP synthase III [Deltaproteobacteria bacterium]